MRKILTLVLAAGLFAALPPTHSQQARGVGRAAAFRSAIDAARTQRDPLVSPRQDGCVAHAISCGQFVTSRITADDCATDPPPVFFDVWFFQGVAGQTITATLSSSDFNPFLILFDPDVNIVAEDDDSGPDLESRIVFTIDETSPDWSLVATPLEENVTGDYTLSLQCCPTGFFQDPSYPDFCFRVTIHNTTAVIPGAREPDCVEDAVCVSGALQGRSEVLIRILGPRPNGFLWPTIVRLTPSRVVTEIHQLSTGATQTYDLAAVPPGSEDLSGRQDRTGFLP